MTSQWAAVAAIGVASAWCLAQQVAIESRSKPPEGSRANIRADVNLVLVPVGVVDRDRHPVTGLEAESFHVFDEGVERPIAHFAMQDEPVTVGLVFDHSGSIGSNLRLEYGATRSFLSSSNPEDRFFLVTFASKPSLALSMTESPGQVQNRLINTISSGSTALVDAVVLGLHELKKEKRNRKALLVVSDGGDNNSRYTKEDLKRIMGESDALVYAIGINSRTADFPFLRWMTEQSGGRALPASKTQELPDIAAKISVELRNRYVLGFITAPGQRDGKYHSLEVKLVPPRGLPPLKATWRRGYYAPDN